MYHLCSIKHSPPFYVVIVPPTVSQTASTQRAEAEVEGLRHELEGAAAARRLAEAAADAQEALLQVRCAGCVEDIRHIDEEAGCR